MTRTPRPKPGAQRTGSPFTQILSAEAAKSLAGGLVGAAVGYFSGFILPPEALYNRLFRPDPNDISGVWTGQVNRLPARLILEKGAGKHDCRGTLEIFSADGRGVAKRVSVHGSHDSAVTLYGKWSAGTALKISLKRTVATRDSPDAKYVFLARDPDFPESAILCPSDDLNVGKCPTFGDGSAYFFK